MQVTSVLIIIAIIALIAIYFSPSMKETTKQLQPITQPITEYLKVMKCGGGKVCSVVDYNSEASAITGQVVLPTQARKSHIIDKGQRGNVVMSDTTRDREIKNVLLQFRYFGEKGIDGIWTIQFKNDALTEAYCIYTLPLSERIAYNEIDVTKCNWSRNKLNDLTIQLTNGDIASAQETFVNTISIKIVYS